MSFLDYCVFGGKTAPCCQQAFGGRRACVSLEPGSIVFLDRFFPRLAFGTGMFLLFLDKRNERIIRERYYQYCGHRAITSND